VRGSLTGSIVSNLLLVLGIALAAGAQGGRSLDRRSLLSQLALVLVAVLLFLIPSVPAWTGNPNRHSLAVASVPVASVLLLLYAVGTMRGLRRHARLHAESGAERSNGWTLPWALAALAGATVVTAFVSETLIHSLNAFSNAVGLSQFFTATVIVAIVGNAAEHGGAIVIARRGNLRLASEIAVSSAAQVALLVTPAVALLSWIVKPALALSFRPVELGTMGASAVAVALIVRNGRATRREGVLLIGLYILAAVAYFIAGDR
jgi:Ca2+:H+ antiporter